MDERLKALATSFRFPIMALAGLSLLLALVGGLQRMGLFMSVLPARVAFHHGGLMVSGFLGTLIAMERAVSLPIPGALTVPLLSGTGALLLILGFDPFVGVGLIVLASVGLIGLFVYIYYIQPSLHNSVLVLGALAWTGGNLLWWLGFPVYQLVNWWMAFLVFVIAAERLELNRLKKFGALQKGFFALGSGLVSLGLLGELSGFAPGPYVFAVGLLITAGWLFRNDMVRQMLSTSGERGYTGWCLVSGYVWLGLGGLIGLTVPEVTSGFYYDAYLHAVFLGFVFTMIFGHAFIIMPGVLNVTLVFHRWFYLPLILLETSLLARIGSDFLEHQLARQASGFTNALSIVLFLAMVLETGVRNTVFETD